MALKKWLDKLTLLDLFDGLSVTGRHLFKKKVTIQYPEQKKLPSDRFDVDLKRCMFCQLCEEACPTNPKSIWLTTKTYEMAAYDRNDSLYLDIRKLTDWRAAENVKPFTVVEQG